VIGPFARIWIVRLLPDCDSMTTRTFTFDEGLLAGSSYYWDLRH
jgi:hypothetical protein